MLNAKNVSFCISSVGDDFEQSLPFHRLDFFSGTTGENGKVHATTVMTKDQLEDLPEHKH